MRTGWVVGVVVVCVLAVGLAVWAVPEPVQSTAEFEPTAVPKVRRPKADREAVRAARAERRAEKRAALREERAAKRAAKAEAEKKEARLPPNERAEARAELRALQLDDLLARHDAYGEAEGWSDGQIDEVADLVIQGASDVSMLLEAVDRGDAPWEEIRPELRDLRLQQAKRVEAVLGGEGFKDWSTAMGFERFQGDEWVRGRTPASTPEP